MSRICEIAKFGLLTAALFVSLVVGASLQAQERPELSMFPAERQLKSNPNQSVGSSAQDQKSSREKSNESKPQLPISKARRNELMNFVRDNHPELEPLINLLKKKRPGQYNSALRSLDKAVTKLNELETSQTKQRYNQALRDWKLRSRIQLLSARLSIKDTPARRDQLERLITQRIDNRVSQLNAEIERTEKRLDRLTDVITELEINREAEIQRQWESAIRSAERIKLSRQKNKKNEPPRQPAGKR